MGRGWQGGCAFEEVAGILAGAACCRDGAAWQGQHSEIGPVKCRHRGINRCQMSGGTRRALPAKTLAAPVCVTGRGVVRTILLAVSWNAGFGRVVGVSAVI